jgi:hypothetical protein
MDMTWKTTEEAALARRLVRSADSGVLSTMSLELPGYPFGSVTPYAMTREGSVAVYVSSIAQHTHNMRNDAKVCLTVAAERGGENQQAVGRVTVVADASEVPAHESGAVAERYFGFFPEARAYAGSHDFAFYRLAPRRVRFIGGFGRIFWVEPEEWIVPAPEWSSTERAIVDHMNDDHAEALRAIAAAHGAAQPGAAELVALDVEGFHVRADSGIHYVPFPSPCLTSDQVRASMIELARSAAAR